MLPSHFQYHDITGLSLWCLDIINWSIVILTAWNTKKPTTSCMHMHTHTHVQTQIMQHRVKLHSVTTHHTSHNCTLNTHTKTERIKLSLQTKYRDLQVGWGTEAELKVTPTACIHYWPRHPTVHCSLEIQCCGYQLKLQSLNLLANLANWP